MERKSIETGKLGGGWGISPLGRKSKGVQKSFRIHSSRKRHSMRWCCKDSAACYEPEYYVQQAKREAEQKRLAAIRAENEIRRKREEKAKEELLLSQEEEYQFFREYCDKKLSESYLECSQITEEFLSTHKRKRQDSFYEYQAKLKKLLNNQKKLISGNSLTDGTYESFIKTFYESSNLSSAKYGIDKRALSNKDILALPSGYKMITYSFGKAFFTTYVIGVFLSYIIYPNLDYYSIIISILIALLITFIDNKIYSDVRSDYNEINNYFNREMEYLSDFYAATHHPIVMKEVSYEKTPTKSLCQYDTFENYRGRYIEEIFGKDAGVNFNRWQACIEDSPIEKDNKHKLQEVDEVWKTTSDAWSKKHYISLYNRDDFLELCGVIFSSRVALADKNYTDEEREFLRNLEGIENFEGLTLPSKEPSIKTLCQLIDKKYKLHDKLDLINTLFAMAEADRIIQNEEVELIREISDLLKIPNSEFEGIKSKSLANIADIKAQEAAIIEQETIDEEFSDIDFEEDD